MDTLQGQEAKEKIWSLVKDIKVAQMATFSGEGKIFHARPMMAQQNSFEGTFWFFTSGDSRKVDEIMHNPTALLTYADPKNQKYISISGKASIIHDKAKVDELWNEPARVWFPKGKDDPNLTLVRFDAEEAEFMDVASSAAIHAYGYIKARLTGEQPKVPGESGRAEFKKAAGE